MRLYIPSRIVEPKDCGDRYVMMREDWDILEEVMQFYPSFEHLKKAVGRRVKDEKIEFRYDGAREKMTNPCNGSGHDTFAALVNAFGAYQEKHMEETIRGQLSKEWVVAQMCEEMDLSMDTVKKRLRTLIQGGWVDEVAGFIRFPQKYIRM